MQDRNKIIKAAKKFCRANNHAYRFLAKSESEYDSKRMADFTIEYINKLKQEPVDKMSTTGA